MKNTVTPQLFNSPYFLYPILLIPLTGLFIVATVFKPALFIVLSSMLTAIIFYLLLLRNGLTKKKSKIDLQIQNYNEQSNLMEVNIRQEKVAIESTRGKIVNFAQLKGFTEKLSMCLTLDDTSKTFSAEVNRLFWEHCNAN